MVEFNKVNSIVNKIKPPRCPHCNCILDYLYYFENVVQKATFVINNPEIPLPDYLSWDTISREDSWFVCPHCDANLDCDEEGAIKLLLGESEGDE